MALSTNQQNDINTMCSRAKEFSIGARLTNMTTAGAYNDGTIKIADTAGTITDGTATLVGGVLTGATLTDAAGVEINSISLTKNQPSTAITTNTSTSAGTLTAGFYYLSSGISSGVYKFTSAPTAGNVVTVYNPGTSTGHLMFSSGGTIVGSFQDGTSFTHLLLEQHRFVSLVAVNSTKWVVLSPSASGMFTSYATST